MPFFQFDKKYHRITLLIALLTLFFMAGCVASKTENLNSSQKNEVQAQSGVTAESDLPPEDVSGQKYIHEIDVKKEDKVLEIMIKGNQKLSYTSIKQPFPFAICVYLPETKINPGLIPGEIENEFVGGLKLSYADQKQTTAKLEILLNQDISYQVQEEGEQLRVLLSLEQLPDNETGPLLSNEITPGSETATATETKSSASLPVVVPDTPGVMTGIEFNTVPSGRSDIRVETNHPIRYDTSRQSDEKLILNLYNTKIPAHHKRPLLTRYFNSAVESIEPKTRSANPKNSTIEINIREQVPFQIVQDQNTITMVFEPSTVEPPLFDKAKKELSNATVETKITAATLPAGNGVEKMSPVKQKPESVIPGVSPPPVYG